MVVETRKKKTNKPSSLLQEIISSTTITFMGMKGYGKTYGSAILANNIDQDLLVFDVVGAYTKDRLIKGAKYLDVDISEPKRAHGLQVLKQFKEHTKVVLNLQALTRENLTKFCEMMFKVINEFGELAILVDEVGDIVSQTKEHYCNEYERTVRVGRNYDIRPVIQITQRPQKADKNVLALSDYYLIMRLNHNLDLNAVQDLIGTDKFEFAETRDKIKNLKQGDFLLLSSDGSYMRGHFDGTKQNIVETTAKKRQRAALEEAEQAQPEVQEELVE